MGLTDFSIGVQGGLQDLIAQRVAAQQRAQVLAQQQFENQRQLGADTRAQKQLDQTGELTRMQREMQSANIASEVAQRQAGAVHQQNEDQNQLMGKAMDVREQMPAGTELPQNSPAAQTFQKFGIVTGTPKDAGMGPMFQGPLPTGEAPQDVTNNKPARFILTPTAKQGEKSDALAASQSDKQAAFDERTANDKAMRNFQGAMVGIAQQNVNTAAAKPSPGDAQSWDKHMKMIETVGKPVADRMERLVRLEDSLHSKTGVADSVIAPELMTAMAGGAGSGVRITNAEINAVLHGRSTIENFKGMLQKIQNGQAITPEQRQQMLDLVGVVKNKVSQKSDAIQAAREALGNVADPQEHNRIYTGLQKSLAAIDSGGGSSAQVGGGLVSMVAPDGRPLQVPAEKVAELEAAGAKRK